MVFLSYKDCIVDYEDYKLLDDGNWINDHILDFAYEYMGDCTYNKAVLESKVQLCCTSVVQLARMSQDSDISAILKSLVLPEKAYIFLPVNDSRCVSGIGGSHWSLLVIDQENSRALHYDSMHQHNYAEALETFDKIKKTLREHMETVEVEKASSPTQANAYDCGMYVIAISELLLKKISKQSREEMSTISPVQISSLRMHYKKLIKDLAAKS